MRPRRSPVVICVLAACTPAVLGACASAPPTTEVDAQKVAQIERAARRMGTQVIWVRMPTKTVASPTP